MYDVVIAGAGPAGLSAALTLGRVRRSVLLVDGGPGRNAPSDGVHNFLSREGIAPGELRRIGLEQLAVHPSVQVRTGRVEHVEGSTGDFQVMLTGGGRERARRLILATGVADVLPPIPGLAERWGNGVVHCPYCHGGERRDQPLAVLGLDEWAVPLAVQVRRFSDDVVLCTNGALEPTEDQTALLKRRGVAVREQPIARLEGAGSSLERIVFDDGGASDRTALFYHAPTRQAGGLPVRLGCTLLDDGSVEVNDFGQTSVAGVFATGDMARRPSMPVPGAQVVIAAAEGTIAAAIIDQELLHEPEPTGA